jgi:TonB-dependent receptor
MMSNKLFFLYKGENSVNKYLLSLLLLLPIAFISADEEADNSEEEVEEIVVTGIKKSLLDAIDIKRSKVGISEALSAEDIGKFPDENLAEALGRVSGVSIIRSNVEGQQIIVRGLGPEFNLVTLNGRQMPTAPWLYESGRSFNWGDISAHGVSAIEIFKSSDSSLPTGGIGSTINMITTKPLNIDKDQVGSFSYNYVHDTTSELDNDLESEIDFSFAKKGDWAFGDYTNEFGFSVTGSYQHRTNREVGMRESNYKLDSGFGDCCDGVPITGGSQRADGDIFLGEPLARQYKDNDRLRKNSQATFQTTIGNDLVLTLDNTVSVLDITAEGQMFGSWYGGWTTQSATVAPDGTVLEAVIGQRTYDHQVIWGATKSINQSEGANLEWNVTDNLVLTFDTHESSAEIKGAQWPNEIGMSPVGVSATVDANWYSDMPSWSYDTDFTADTYAYTGGIAFDGHKINNLTQNQINGELTLDMGPLTSIEFGVSSVKQHFEHTQREAAVTATDSSIPAGMLVRTSTDGLVDSLTGTDPGYYFDVDPLAIAADFQEKNGWDAGPVDYDEGVEEQLDQAFIQFNFSSEINNMPLDVILGVRYEEAETVSTSNLSRPAYVAAANFLVFTMEEGTSTESGATDAFLPSLQASLGISDTEVVRFSYSETISRPHLADLSAGRSYGSRQFQVATASGGNPQLEPYESTNFDLAYENYYKEGSYFSFNLFHKDLTNYVGREVAQNVVLFDDLFNPMERTDAAFQEAWAWAVNQVDNHAVYGDYNLFSTLDGSVQCTSFVVSEDPDCPVGIDWYASYDAWNAAGYELYRSATWYRFAAGGNQSWSFDQFDRNVAYLYYAINYLNYLTTGTYDPSTCEGWLCNDGLLMTDGFTGGATGTVANPLVFAEVSRPANNLEGSVQGVEVAWQHLFDNGYGFQFNYILTEGDNVEADRYSTAEQFYIPGLADSGNISVFYEDNKLTARLGINYADERPSGAADYLQPIFVEARTHVDANFSYNLDMGGTVSLDILNVTDEPTRLYARNPNMSFLAQDHGVVYKLGYRVTF